MLLGIVSEKNFLYICRRARTSGRVQKGHGPEPCEESGEEKGDGEKREPGATTRGPKREQTKEHGEHVTKMAALCREGHWGEGSPAPGLDKFRVRDGAC